MRDIEKGRDIDRGRSTLPAGSLMRDSIPGPWDHDLKQRQTLNHRATQVTLRPQSHPGDPKFIIPDVTYLLTKVSFQ